LQSRLLERINTKKQKSPEQIYLEEELSSDEDEDIKEQDEENDDFDNKTTERNGKANVGKENNEDYDEENAADIEDAANNE